MTFPRLPALLATFLGLALSSCCVTQVAAVGIGLFSVGAARAADEPARPAAADWSRERFQLGTWRCTTRSPQGKEGEYKAVFTLEYGGSVLRARIIATDAHGRSRIADFNTVRPDDHTYAGVWVTDSGAIGTWTNVGWTGNQFTEVGYTLVDGKLTDRTEFLFTKISDTEYTYADQRNGKVFAEDRCRKISS